MEHNLVGGSILLEYEHLKSQKKTFNVLKSLNALWTINQQGGLSIRHVDTTPSLEVTDGYFLSHGVFMINKLQEDIVYWRYEVINLKK